MKFQKSPFPCWSRVCRKAACWNSVTYFLSHNQNLIAGLLKTISVCLCVFNAINVMFVGWLLPSFSCWTWKILALPATLSGGFIFPSLSLPHQTISDIHNPASTLKTPAKYWLDHHLYIQSNYGLAWTSQGPEKHCVLSGTEALVADPVLWAGKRSLQEFTHVFPAHTTYVQSYWNLENIWVKPAPYKLLLLMLWQQGITWKSPLWIQIIIIRNNISFTLRS